MTRTASVNNVKRMSKPQNSLTDDQVSLSIGYRADVQLHDSHLFKILKRLVAFFFFILVWFSFFLFFFLFYFTRHGHDY